jgi:hypothetical protein
VFVVSCTDYFIDGGVVVLNKPIDREDTDLFPDQSNTYIILYLEQSCESDENTAYKFWDKRYLTNFNFNLFSVYLIHEGYDPLGMELVNTEMRLQISYIM